MWKLTLHLWSCNQSVALKHVIIRQQVNGTLQNSRILRNTDLQWYSNITSQYLGTTFQHFVCTNYWLHVFLPVSSTFFQFLPEETGRNTFFPVSSILPGRNLFLPEVSEPCDLDCSHLVFLTRLVSMTTKDYFFDLSEQGISYTCWHVG